MAAHRPDTQRYSQAASAPLWLISPHPQHLQLLTQLQSSSHQAAGRPRAWHGPRSPCPAGATRLPRPVAQVCNVCKGMQQAARQSCNITYALWSTVSQAKPADGHLALTQIGGALGSPQDLPPALRPMHAPCS